MHITMQHAPPTHQHHEPQRPAQHQVQETSRPVVAPTQSEASAQETRHNNERRVGRDGERHPDVHNRQNAAKTAAEAAERHERQRPDRDDSAVGSRVDVFA